MSQQIRIPASAVSELEWVEKMDWDEGVTLTALIDWINEVVEMYRPDDQDSRSSPNFTARSFRHYQTLGCIDSPKRVGKQARYEFRHYLQALLIRKLLWERVSSGQIAALLAGKSNEEYKTLLFEGISIIPAESGDKPDTSTQTWSRTKVSDGVELHIASDCRGPLEEEMIQAILEAVEKRLRAL